MKNQRLLAEKQHFFRDYSKFSDFGQIAKGQFWPIFMGEVRKLRKLRNTYRLLVKRVLLDGDFIERFVKRKTMKNQRVLAEKQHFFQHYSKFSNFNQNAKSQLQPIFMAELRKPRKLRNTYRILVKIVLFDAEFIQCFLKRKTMKNQRPLAEKQHFLPDYSMFSDFGHIVKANFSRFSWLKFESLIKLRNTYLILVKMVLFNAKFIEGFVKRKTMKNQRVLAKKSHFFRDCSKFSDFGQNSKGQF